MTDAPTAPPSRFSCCSNMKCTSPGPPATCTDKCPCAMESGVFLGALSGIEATFPIIFTEHVDDPQPANRVPQQRGKRPLMSYLGCSSIRFGLTAGTNNLRILPRADGGGRAAVPNQHIASGDNRRLI